MNQLITNDIEMTSLDIAEVTGKRHDHVMRDIRNEINELGKEISRPIFGESTYKNGRGREYPCYMLNKKGAMQLALKYDAKTRHRVIERIEELESQQTQMEKPSYMIDDPIKRAEKWIVEQTETKALAQENNKLKPKATYHDLVLQSQTLLTTTQVAKDFGLGAPTLNKMLHELGVQYKKGHRWYLYHKHQNEGYSQSRTHVVSADETKDYMCWTQKGRLFIYKTLKSEKGILPIVERENEQLRLVQ